MMTPRTLEDEELDELREAVAAWRASRRLIATLLGAIFTLIALLVGWGVSVESRLSVGHEVDRAREITVMELKTTQQAIIVQLIEINRQLAEHRAKEDIDHHK